MRSTQVTLHQVVTHPVGGGYQKSVQKPYTYFKQPIEPMSIPGHRFIKLLQSFENDPTHLTNHISTHPDDPHTHSMGGDGSLHPALSCKYCQDTNHDVCRLGPKYLLNWLVKADC